MGGDPDPNKHKYWIATYTCDETSGTSVPQYKTLSGKEGDTANFNCKVNTGSIVYGAKDKYRSYTIPKDQTSVKVDNNTMGGDPNPDVQKFWFANYTCADAGTTPAGTTTPAATTAPAAGTPSTIPYTCSGICQNTLQSENKTCNLEMQGDGNLVIYKKDRGAIWATGTNGKGTAPYKLAMQGDGNLVIYDKNNTATWATGTNGKGTAPYKLNMQGDCNLVIYDKNNTATWEAGIRNASTSCYGAKDGVCNTCNDVINAYKAKNWRYNTSDFEQCK